MMLPQSTTRLGLTARPARLAVNIPLRQAPVKLNPSSTRAPTELRVVGPAGLVAGAAFAAAFLGVAGWQFTRPQQVEAVSGVRAPEPAVAQPPPPPPPPPRENAVLVLGATGRVGRRVVQRLLQAGRTVVAAARSAEKADKVFGEMGITRGLQQDNGGILFVEADVDVTLPEGGAEARLWKGVTQVVSVLGTVFGPLPGGGFGIIDDMSPERVEGQGITAVVAAMPERLKKWVSTSREVLSLRGDALSAWQKLDDSVMGGTSASALEPSADGSGAVWKGNLILEGGGFCGAIAKLGGTSGLNLSDSDGLELCVKGDGSVFKLNINMVDQEYTPYQTTFDTVADTWVTVRLPWHNFFLVKQSGPTSEPQTDPSSEPLNPALISQLGLILSSLEFNGAPNPSFKAGPFELHLRGGISAYAEARPQILLVSSAGVERNAIIGDDQEARQRDIPIVQLNPGGTLNWKYMAETAIRASGYPYAIIRATGMVDPPTLPPPVEGAAPVPATFQRTEADQGDSMSGQISRDQVAEALVAALSSPEATGKTFELRRGEAADVKKKATPMGQRDWLRLFLKLSLDRNRWRVGLPPFPKPVPPPAPVTEERLKEILEDVARVRAEDTVSAAVAK